MKVTNKNNLPEALVKAVENDGYSKGKSDFSVTGLLKPPRAAALELEYYNEIEIDVEDRIYALYGQLIHSLLERANKTDLVEERFFAEFLGKIVSGQIDSLSIESDILTDYKFTTAWKFIGNKEPDPSFVAQLNMQLELLRRNGHDAKGLQIVGLIRDHSKMRIIQDRNYPQCPVVTQPIPMWPREQTVAFIEERIRLHLQAREELPLCTPEERWAKPDVWAVMKGKRAISGGLCSSQTEAEEMKEKNAGTFIQHRPGESVRCAQYCPAAKFCTQYKEGK